MVLPPSRWRRPAGRPVPTSGAPKYRRMAAGTRKGPPALSALALFHPDDAMSDPDLGHDRKRGPVKGGDRRRRHGDARHSAAGLTRADEWEYPWFAARDLDFHAIPLAHVDPDFVKGTAGADVPGMVDSPERSNYPLRMGIR